MVNYTTPGSLGAEVIRPYIRQDRDFIMIISGPTSEGKSTAALQVSKAVDPNFNMEDQIVYTKKQLIECIKTLPKYSAILPDEAINILYKRDFMKGDQKELLKLLDMCRKRNLFMVLTLPIFWDLDNKILCSDRIKLWVHVVERGLGYMHVPDDNYFGSDKWHRKDNEKLIKRLGPKAIPYSCPNFKGCITFPDLEPDVKKRYLEICERKSAYSEREGEPEEEAPKVEPEEVRNLLIKELVDKGLVPHGFITRYANYRGVKPKTMMYRVRAGDNQKNEVKIPEEVQI